MTDRVAEFLARFDGSRARVVHEALKELDSRMTEYRVVFAELVYEVRRDKLWQQVPRENNTRYATANAYFWEVLDFTSHARLQQYIAVGKFLHTIPPDERPEMRLALAVLGMQKSEMIASVAKYRPKDVRTWIDLAKRTSIPALRKTINAALHPKGRTGRGSVGSWPIVTRLRSHLCALGVAPHLVDDFYAAAKAHGLADEPKSIMTAAITEATERWSD